MIRPASVPAAERRAPVLDWGAHIEVAVPAGSYRKLIARCESGGRVRVLVQQRDQSTLIGHFSPAGMRRLAKALQEAADVAERVDAHLPHDL